MPLNHKDWARVTALRNLYGASGRKQRWSITTSGFDDRGRKRQLCAKLCGPYPGGLSEPFFFDDLESLTRFLSESLNNESRKILKKQETLEVEPTFAQPVRRRRRKAA